jgi:hypothetical protein
VGDVKPSLRSKEQRVRQSWTEVGAETKKVFEGCEQLLIGMLNDRPRGAPTFSGTTSNSLHPDTCYQEFKFRLNFDNRFPDTVPILDVRLERDYSHELGAASCFRIVPNLVEREGRQLFEAMIDHIKNKKCPYEIIDPNSEQGKKLTENYRRRYASP